MGLFGRGKDDRDDLACAQCGRTLLAGEWTQRVVDDDGSVSLVCSLCSQGKPLEAGEPLVVSTGSPNASRLKESRDDSDAFWRAIKEKYAEIERLQAQIARGEAERQELTARLAQVQRQLNGEAPYDGEYAFGPASEPAAAEPEGGTTVPAEFEPLPAERPAEFEPLPAQPAAAEPVSAGSAEVTASHPYDVLGGPTQEPSEAHPYAALEPDAIERADLGATMPGERPAFIDEPIADIETTMPGVPVPSEEPSTFAAAGAPIIQSGGLAGAAPASAGATAAGAPAEPAAPVPEPAPEPLLAADDAELTLLQRGVDLLNVSPVPKKIGETNEHLGMPSVHVGFAADRLAVTFLWTMGWYRYEVDIEGAGTVRLSDRGYEERTDLTPNASVRADGTVQLAAARITRPTSRPENGSAGVPPANGAAPAVPSDDRADQPAPAVNRGDIISKSLMGQRTDDEEVSWDKQQSRDFKWDH
jgi:hypothetical protein